MAKNKTTMKLTLQKISMKLQRKTVVYSSFLSDRIRRFVRNTSFDSRYISLIIKISANNGSFWRCIDRRTIIDLENRDDVTNYINKLIRYTNSNIEDWYNGLNPEYLHFQWINATEKDYIIYKNNIKISKLYKKLDIKIDKPYNFPFNEDYSTWGSSVTVHADETVITNISFDRNIESITVKEIDFNNNKVIFNYNNEDIKSFIDSNIKYGRYLRSFSFGLQYYFNDTTSAPMFYF